LKTLKLTIEYDGTDFCGWQFQPSVRTVQGELEAAFEKLLQAKTTVYGSGRTDTGVHAIGQTAHVKIDDKQLGYDQIRKAINSLTGFDLLVKKVEEVPLDFHARFNAISRCYNYRLIRQPFPLMRRFAWFPGYEWNDELIEQAVYLLNGRHSFKSFCRFRPEEDVYSCKIFEVHWKADEYGAIFKITADRFFYQMVRGLVGALVDVGRKYYSIDDFRRLLDEPEENAQVRFAPARGLVLMEVKYTNGISSLSC